MTSLSHVGNVLNTPEHAYLGRTIDDLQNYFQGVVGSPGRESVIFCSKRGLEMLSRQDTLAGDGTFYMAPDIDGVKQIWILSAFKHGKVFPVAMALMSAMDEPAYAAVLEFLKEKGLAPPAKVISDWEPAQRNAFRKAFPNAEMTGCIWHFVRAIYKQAGLKGLGKFWKKKHENTPVASLLRLYALLPRLPHTYILKGVQLLEAKAKKDLRGSELKKFRKFQKYFRKEWIVKVGVEELSVHGHEIKATSGLESFNRKFNSMSPNKRPPFWKLLLTMKDLEQEVFREHANFYRTGKGKDRAPRMARRDVYLVDRDLTEAVKRLERGEVDVMGFLLHAQSTLTETLATLRIYGMVDVAPTERDDISPSVPVRRRRKRVLVLESEASECDDPAPPASTQNNLTMNDDNDDEDEDDGDDKPDNDNTKDENPTDVNPQDDITYESPNDDEPEYEINYDENSDNDNDLEMIEMKNNHGNDPEIIKIEDDDEPEHEINYDDKISDNDNDLEIIEIENDNGNDPEIIKIEIDSDSDSGDFSKVWYFDRLKKLYPSLTTRQLLEESHVGCGCGCPYNCGFPPETASPDQQCSSASSSTYQDSQVACQMEQEGWPAPALFEDLAGSCEEAYPVLLETDFSMEHEAWPAPALFEGEQ
ncbi:uncharacterized protein LOC113215927 isoform X2 [Frankliniella occidentalis]|uniref:Uncharacterized protein LOC113215927 isoform X2 n=1 Tax=Frankliniella occidentalis TaxID=133901 RepID=A0A9C6X919_FRAOC|nr:uncharacterized protein LOC113215927 isoform X2 [Frankliniella occidentalis]